MNNKTISQANKDIVRCQCGAWSGETCSWTGHRGETVLVEYMPEQYRASHEAAGNRSVYPHNGSQRIRVSPECANQMVSSDGAWCSIVARAVESAS